jgi:uncharacterized membrane protein
MAFRGVPGKASVGGVLLGVGLGGFVDGIVLHQILQWHNMLSSVVPPSTMETMKRNMLWDGLFHAGVWVATLSGVLLVWAAAREAIDLPSVRWLIGVMLIGWGLFNFVEGLIDHHVLGIHHVRGWGPNRAWDIGFLLSGPLFGAFGWLLARSAHSGGTPPA